MPAKYDQIGSGYNATRKAYSRIVDRIVELLALSPESRILDIGAGTGSYSSALAERGYTMTALEPSSVMRDQASVSADVEWREGVAESLPFPDDSFDGAIMILCIHHFTNLGAALSEAQRVVQRGPIVLLSYDPDAVEAPWLFEYFPIFRDQIRASFPAMDIIRTYLGDNTTIKPFLLPHDLADGFAGAAWRCPERYLDADFRKGTSAFRQLDEASIQKGLRRLEQDLRSGKWDAGFGAIRSLAQYDHGYVFITAGNKK